MDIRKSAVELSVPERDRFLDALIRLKQRPAPGVPPGIDFSMYDQFVLLHGAVMAVLAPSETEPVNMAHWNIGFCPWHRQYIRTFEKALQKETNDSSITLPYWDWVAHPKAISTLFTNDFLGELRQRSPANLVGSVLRNPVPIAERPAWWPSGAIGWPIAIQEKWGASLQRGTPPSSIWPASATQIESLEQLDSRIGFHHYWPFWLVLEGGVRDIRFFAPQSTIPVARLTHNAGHNFIGGHMSGVFSPNDPIFWLHHANADRIWDRWQQFQIQKYGGTHENHYPSADEPNPWNGDPIPNGHGIDDLMWPWVGNVAGYDTQNLQPMDKNLLPDFKSVPPVRVSEVLDTAAMDYRYE